MRTLRENLDKVFLEALTKLKGPISLRGEELCFSWVFSDDAFEARSMRLEENGGGSRR